VLTAATAGAHDVTTLSVLRFFTGVGLGGATPNAAALASEYVPRRHRPFAVTLTIVCIPLGGTLAGMLAIHILPAYGWRVLYLIGGIIPVATAVMLFALLPESPRFMARHPRRWPELARSLNRMGHAVPPDASFADPTEHAVTQGSFAALFGTALRSDTLALWGAYLSCMLGVYLGFNWVPAMMTGAGMSPTVASTGITAYNLGGVLGAVGGALAFARIGSRATMLGMAAGSIAGALVLRSMVFGPASAAMPIVVMLGVTGGLINAVQTTMYALAAHVYPVGVRATGMGTAAAIGRIGAIASTYAGAWALEAGGSRLFFSFVAAAMLACFVSLALVKRHILGPTRA
jgi:AAHS family 4-hydroxybenzoate transporter-like MFS transporter